MEKQRVPIANEKFFYTFGRDYYLNGHRHWRVILVFSRITFADHNCFFISRFEIGN